MNRPLRYAGSIILLLCTHCFAQDTTGQAPDSPDASKQGKLSTTLTNIRDLPAVWIIGPYIPSGEPLQPLTGSQRADVYFHQTFLTFGSYALRLFTAGIDQARGTPYQWGGGMQGYGKRFGNRYGQFMIANTFQTAGNAALGYESRYDLCRCIGFWPRTKHAIARNFVVYNHTEQELRPAIPLYAGAFGAGALSSVWLPGQRSAWKEGGYGVLEQAGFGSAYNFASEFAFDILRKITKNRYPKRPNPSPVAP